jgi:DNA-binding winged helix-turn-helix (wHTH) protein/tetratricopeptide (TPR) repeat protein
MLSTLPTCGYEFGAFRLDASRRLLWRDGAPVPLSPKTFETLLLLVREAGRVLRKEEFIARIWPDCHVEERNLTQHIFTLRKALGEGATEHLYIVTVPGQGYSFVAPVRELAGTETPSAAQQTNDGRAADESVAGVAAIAGVAGVAVLVNEELRPDTPRHTDNAEAFQAYIRGRYFWNKRTAEGLHKAIEYFGQAIALDPAYALAFAGLADAYNLLAGHGGLHPRDTFPQAKAAAERALVLDDTLAEAYASLGFVSYRFDWNWPDSARHFRRAIALQPHYATAHHWFGESLAAAGRFDESLAELGRAQQHDPLSLPVNTDLGQSLYFARRYEEAARQLEKTLEMDDTFPRALIVLAAVYERQGRHMEAIETSGRAAKLSPANPLALSGLGHARALAGQHHEARRILSDLERLAANRYVSAYNVAAVHAGLGEREAALDHLEQAAADSDVWLVWLKCDPRFDRLRDDARCAALLRRVNP